MDLSQLQASLQNQSSGRGLPPVDLWNPDFCGDMDLIIQRNGQWQYQGTPIGRKALVKLFASILKREGDDYFLVTPVEKVGIQVEDSPLHIVEWEFVDSSIAVRTLTDDTVVISAEHPVALQYDASSDAHIPYVLIRRNLWARVHQNVFYQWAEQAELSEQNGKTFALLSSGDYTFSLGTI